MESHAYYLKEKPTIWQRLGFGTCTVEPPAPAAGFADGHITTQVFVKFGLADRIRVLLSGKIMVSAATATNVFVHTAVSTSKVSVLSPAHKFPQPEKHHKMKAA
jgi:hypothetical protein